MYDISSQEPRVFSKESLKQINIFKQLCYRVEIFKNKMFRIEQDYAREQGGKRKEAEEAAVGERRLGGRWLRRARVLVESRFPAAPSAPRALKPGRDPGDGDVTGSASPVCREPAPHRGGSGCFPSAGTWISPERLASSGRRYGRTTPCSRKRGQLQHATQGRQLQRKCGIQINVGVEKQTKACQNNPEQRPSPALHLRIKYLSGRGS